MPLSQTNVIGVFCVYTGMIQQATKGKEKSKRQTNNYHITQAYNNNTQGPNNTVNEYNQKKHKTKGKG